MDSKICLKLFMSMSDGFKTLVQLKTQQLPRVTFALSFSCGFIESTQKRCWKHSESANHYRGPTVSSSSCQFICLELFKLSRPSQINLSGSSLDATHTACLFKCVVLKTAIKNNKKKKHYKLIQIQYLHIFGHVLDQDIYIISGAASHEVW